MRSPHAPRAIRLPAAFAALLTAAALLAGCTAGSSSPTVGQGAGTSGSSTSGATPAGDPATSPTTTPSPTASPTPTPPPLAQLPRGGRTILPTYRVVAYYGNGQSAGLGVLGHYPPDIAAARLARTAAAYATRSRPVLPALELIVSIADGFPGPDGNYSHDTAPAEVERYLRAARRAKALLVLDIQPGRQEFLPVVRRYEQFLVQPDVELALDPEWRMGPGQVPGSVIGHVDASEINAVSAYLSGLTTARRLPQKVLLLHEFTPRMIQRKQAVLPRRDLAIVWHVDGFGSRSDKLYDYAELHMRRPFFNGFKLFYRQDVDMFTPAELLRLKPPPDFVSYQ